MVETRASLTSAGHLRDYSGILLVDKPAGWTSQDICQFVKSRFRLKKVGHGGTLDPFATGLLVLYLNGATSRAEESLHGDKTYEAVLHLGRRTSTGDPEGKILQDGPAPELDPERIQEVLSGFVGDYWHEPPMTSAVKRNGVPLYRLARKGLTVPREKRKVTIYELTHTAYEMPYLHVRARVSRGTYVRVLAEDIGNRLGTTAFLSALRRVASGEFSLTRAVTVDELRALKTGDLGSCLIPLAPVVRHERRHSS